MFKLEVLNWNFYSSRLNVSKHNYLFIAEVNEIFLAKVSYKYEKKFISIFTDNI